MQELTANLGNRTVGEGCPVYVIGEIGINHNGDVEIAKRLIDAAVDAHFFSYDISKDLSFKIMPIQINGINQPCISSGGTLTLKL